MAEDISISGKVQGYDGHDRKPIHMIKVAIYRDRQLVDRVYTDEEGWYMVSVPAGEPITVCFDTHASLTNAREWHPSVVANVDATQDVLLDRVLMRVGTISSETAAIDALAAYQFCAMWADADPHRGYAEHAAARLAMMKFTVGVLLDICNRLQEHFDQQARSP